MPEHKIELTGWKAMVVAVALIGVVVTRFMTFSDQKDNSALMKKIDVQLMSDYYPTETERLKTVYDSGDADRIEEVAKSVTSTKANVESVKVSYPFLKFSSPKDVVVKVTYSLNDDYGRTEERTRYYLFTHGSLINHWQYRYKTTALSYYLNFF